MYRALGILVVVFGLASFGSSQQTTSQSGIRFDEWSSSKQTKFVDDSLPPAISNSLSGSLTIDPSRLSTSKPQKTKFHWKPAVLQSMNFLAIQQGIMIASDQWTRYNLTHHHWFQTYMKAVRGNTHWDDGDPWVDNYVGHPIQGALTGFIQIQNDPSGRRLEFSNTRAYWKSRLKAMGWNAAYSTLFEIGPFGEASIAKLGSYEYRNCANCKITNGAGFVDFVITPTVGTAWLVGEDLIDKAVPAKLESRYGRNGWTNLLRCVLNPARSGANILAHRAPWYRASRDEVK
jgi:hypothetical protein